MQSVKRALFFVVIAVTGVSFALDAIASGHKRKRRKKKGKKIEAAAPYEYYEAKGLFATGLKPVFPDGFDCPPISSPYGSMTRYDGSRRNNAHHGYHDGMDITLDIGTPLLSVADGEVIHTGSAGRLVGNYVWLRYAPEVTGLSVHVFARYQHLDEPSPLDVGDRVRAGQSVGPAGRTGTTGGHYGDKGYPHMHLVFRTGPGPDFSAKGATIGPKSLNYLDPLGLYVDFTGSEVSNHVLRDLPAARKNVPVPIVTGDGAVVPEGARTVWPVACRKE